MRCLPHRPCWRWRCGARCWLTAARPARWRAGWRSWNAFNNRISEQTFYDVIDAITAKNFSVDGAKVSLADVGYRSVGIDEVCRLSPGCPGFAAAASLLNADTLSAAGQGWEGCGLGFNATQHFANGTPAVNLTRFPDMGALVDFGHSKDLEMGFYLNGCMCGEPFPWSPSPPGQERVADYVGDIEYLSALNFDGVKIDDCGAQRNMTKYARLMQATQRNFTIEDCHWGQCSEDDDSSCPTSDWCPFNLFRSSTDINTGAFGWWRNLQSMTRFQDLTAPLSRPGCWAYPGMHAHLLSLAGVQ